MTAVCIVDDDADIREVLSDVLSIEGYQVIPAGDGEAALGLLRSQESDCRLILLDLMMPHMNGWEFRRQQLQDPAIASIPVVLLSGAGTAAKLIDELHRRGFDREARRAGDAPGGGRPLLRLSRERADSKINLGEGQAETSASMGRRRQNVKDRR